MDGETECYGKVAEDLQEDIGFRLGTSIYGTLKYVTDYSQFNGGTDEREGTYLALAFEIPEGMSVTTELVGGPHGQVTVEDEFFVYRITDPAAQTIEVVATKGDDQETIVYSLESLVCEIPEDAVLDSVQDPIRDDRYNPIRGEN